MCGPTCFLPFLRCGHLEYVGGVQRVGNRVLIRSGLHTGITWCPHHTSGGTSGCMEAAYRRLGRVKHIARVQTPRERREAVDHLSNPKCSVAIQEDRLLRRSTQTISHNWRGIQIHRFVHDDEDRLFRMLGGERDQDANRMDTCREMLSERFECVRR